MGIFEDSTTHGRRSSFAEAVEKEKDLRDHVVATISVAARRLGVKQVIKLVKEALPEKPLKSKKRRSKKKRRRGKKGRRRRDYINDTEFGDPEDPSEEVLTLNDDASGAIVDLFQELVDDEQYSLGDHQFTEFDGDPDDGDDDDYDEED